MALNVLNKENMFRIPYGSNKKGQQSLPCNCETLFTEFKKKTMSL